MVDTPCAALGPGYIAFQTHYVHFTSVLGLSSFFDHYIQSSWVFGLDFIGYFLISSIIIQSSVIWFGLYWGIISFSFDHYIISGEVIGFIQSSVHFGIFFFV